jgi:two-component system sensor histidine kinase BarA
MIEEKDMDIGNKEAYLTIDWPLALKLANNEPDWAKKMLAILAEELPDVKAELQCALAQADHEQVARLVHKLHGACCYCGVPRLKMIVEQFKSVVKPNHPETLNQFAQQLIEEMDAVISAVEADNFWQ